MTSSDPPLTSGSLTRVPPPSEFTWDSIFLPPGIDLATAKKSPFHVYHPDFYKVIGEDPRLALVLETEGYYSAHEAPGESRSLLCRATSSLSLFATCIEFLS